MNVQATDWEKIFVIHILNKELVPRVSKVLLQLNKKDKQMFFKWAKDLNRHFIKEYIWMANKNMNEVQIKITIMY